MSNDVKLKITNRIPNSLSILLKTEAGKILLYGLINLKFTALFNKLLTALSTYMHKNTLQHVARASTSQRK